MSETEWTVERLSSLPENTILHWQDVGLVIMTEYGWFADVYDGAPGVGHSFDAMADDSDALRVVSVPIDALKSEETLAAMALAHYSPATEGVFPAQWEIDNMQHVAHAAVAHITGGTP